MQHWGQRKTCGSIKDGCRGLCGNTGGRFSHQSSPSPGGNGKRPLWQLVPSTVVIEERGRERVLTPLLGSASRKQAHDKNHGRFSTLGERRSVDRDIYLTPFRTAPMFRDKLLGTSINSIECDYFTITGTDSVRVRCAPTAKARP